MIEIIKDKGIWDSLVNNCDLVDFYHSYDYHHISKLDGEEPILIHYIENGVTILVFPLLIRNIENSPYKDATSVYGYPGPIFHKAIPDFDYGLFRIELHHFFLEKKVISVFSRLNPFLSFQENCLNNLGKIVELGSVVYIDLTNSLDDQWASYHKRLRTYINKSRTIYTIKKAKGTADLESFICLYYENMRRVNADAAYFFDHGYFLNLMKCSDFETEILLAIDVESGEVAGGAMFTKKNSIIQYHLSGSRDKFLDLNPVKLLIDEMRIKGTQEGYHFFNLGGGVGSKKDSLYYFKSGFSKTSIPFKVWKYVVDQNGYDNLVEQTKHLRLADKPNQYFPLYRDKNNISIEQNAQISVKRSFSK